MMPDMVYAPIYIPTLCRYEHFVRCVESLKRNTWASKTDVYIALDYPARESHWDGYQKICQYLDGDFAEFNSFTVFRREKNYGSAQNSQEMMFWVLERYDRFIRTDDDIEFAPNFIEYIDKCLQEYEDDPTVIAISGYSYPIDWKVSNSSTALKLNCVCPMWGTAFWKKKYELVQNEIKKDFFRKNADKFIRQGKIKELVDARIVSFANALSLENSGLMHGMSDIGIGAYLALAGKYIISPVISKSRNYGFDGSGVYCQKVRQGQNRHITAQNYYYPDQVIDEDRNYLLILDNLNDIKENNKRYNQFDTRTWKQITRAKVRIGLYRLLGESNFYKLLEYRKLLKNSIG